MAFKQNNNPFLSFLPSTPSGPYSTASGDFMTGQAQGYGGKDTKIGTLQEDGTMGIYQPYSRDAYDMHDMVKTDAGIGVRPTEFGETLDSETYSRLYGKSKRARELAPEQVYQNKGSVMSEIEAAQHGKRPGSIHEFNRYARQKGQLKAKGGDNFAKQWDLKGTDIYNRHPAKGREDHGAGKKGTNMPPVDVFGGGGGGSWGSKRQDRQARRHARRLQRQTRRHNRKQARQQRRQNEGGFFRRLIDKIF